jgi:hypothetical protein
MGTDKAADVQRAAALLKKRDSGDLYTRVAVEMKLKQLSADALTSATANRATSSGITVGNFDHVGSPDAGATTAQDTQSVHDALYADASDAHGPGVGGTPAYLLNWLTQQPFGWDKAPQSGPQLVDQWLLFYGFKPITPTWAVDDPAACEFNGDGSMSVQKVTDLFMHDMAESGRQVARTFAAGEVNMALDSLRQKQKAKEAADPMAGLGGGPDPKGSGPAPARSGASPDGDKSAGNASTQIGLGFQFNLTKHKSLSSGATSTDPATLQLNGQVTIPFHKDGQPGLELSFQGSVSLFLQAGSGSTPTVTGVTVSNVTVQQLSNVQVNAQGAWVIPFFQNALQLSLFVQAVGGINWDAVPDGGSQQGSVPMVTLKPDAMAQAVGGVQLTYTLPNTDNHLQMFAAQQGSVTGSHQGGTVDSTTAVGIQLVW